MPPGRDAVVTVGISIITIISCSVAFPAEFVAIIVKLNVPVAVGTPFIAPLVVFKFKPAGRLPMETDQVIGVVPVALSV
jgi:hypothetical protein